MTRKNKIFWIGLLIYAVSFVMPSVDGFTSQSTSGIFCAFATLVYPWAELEAKLIHGLRFVFGPSEYVSLLIAGLINPVFLFSISPILCDRCRRFAATLKIILVLMIPFCWVFFYLKHLRPLGGHFLWIIGMFTTIFSNELTGLVPDHEATSTEPMH